MCHISMKDTGTWVNATKHILRHINQTNDNFHKSTIFWALRNSKIRAYEWMNEHDLPHILTLIAF